MEETEHIEIVILAAGVFPKHQISLQALRKAFFIICCDGAYKELKNSEFSTRNYVVVGDGDSLSPEEKHALGDRYVCIQEQDYNDLHKAVHYALGRWPGASITILGATGKREDHTLGNIGHLADFAELMPDIQMLTDHGRLTIAQGCRHYRSFPGQQVSLFSMTPEEPVSTEGLRWPLKGQKITRWWQATLNCSLDYEFTVRGGKLVVFQTHEPKGAGC